MFNCPKKPMFKAPTGSSGPVKDTSSSLLDFSSASLEESYKVSFWLGSDWWSLSNIFPAGGQGARLDGPQDGQ